MLENFLFGRVIIEPHTYCNRSCNFCIVNYMDPIYKKKVFYMLDTVFNRVLNVIYDNINLFKHDPLTISLFKYNEPLYDLENINMVKKRIKDFFNKRNIETYLYIHTNGDYLNTDNFESIMDNLDQLIVNDYSDRGFSHSIKRFSNFSNVKFEKVEKSMMNKKDKVYYSYKGKSIISYINSTSGMLKTTRGSVLQDYLDINNSGKWMNNAVKRNYDCDVIGRIFVVDYNGDVFPCCDTSSRIPKHKDMCVGNVMKNSINDIINNTKSINIYEKKACEYCHMCKLNCSYIDNNLKYDANR